MTFTSILYICGYNYAHMYFHTRHGVSYNVNPGLAVIKLSSQFFVLVLENQPIKMLNFMFRA